jgi:hypothetical protein
MSELKEYIVTLHRHEDLTGFYEDMESNGYALKKKRNISRNTHYLLTDQQAEDLKNDERVLAVNWAHHPLRLKSRVLGGSYTISGTFFKDDTSASAWTGTETAPLGTPAATDRQWGQLHCAGTDSDRGKGSFGSINTTNFISRTTDITVGEAVGGGTTESKNGTVTVWNDGKDVDVIISDTPLAYDCEEWKSPSTGNNRFVQYAWNDLNSIVELDAGESTLSSYSYYSLSDMGSDTQGTTPTDHWQQSHGIHVGGTAAGKNYGWAVESNIYSINYLDPVMGYSLFDYVRAFHRKKWSDGNRTPTIINNSWLDLTALYDYLKGNESTYISSVKYRNVTYTPGDTLPNDAGNTWDHTSLKKAFGIDTNWLVIPYINEDTIADIEDAADEGIVVVTIPHNFNNYFIKDPTHPDYNNQITISNFNSQVDGTWDINKPPAPAAAIKSIVVGALAGTPDFRKSCFSGYGPAVDIFAPGSNIISCVLENNKVGQIYSPWQGNIDTKSGYTGNYYLNYSGTSMAAPQVTGVLACAATKKSRFTYDDAIYYLQKTSKKDDMTFNVSGGGFDDPTLQKESPNAYLLAKSPREETGYLMDQKGTRKESGNVWPRRNTFIYKN